MIFDSPEANQRLSDTAAEAPPATFMDRFNAADKQAQASGLVTSRLLTMSEDYDRRIKDIKEAGLGDLTDMNPMTSNRRPQVYSEGHSIYDMEPLDFSNEPHKLFQKKLEELAQKRPDMAHIIKADKPITGSEEYQAAKKAAEAASGSYGGAPLTGPIADFAGGMYAMRKDPANITALVVGPSGHVGKGAKAILMMGAKQALANASVEAAMQPFIQSWRKSMNDNYGVWQAAEEIGMAAAFGFGADVGIRSLYRGAQSALGRKAILDAEGKVTGYESGADAAARAAAAGEHQRRLQIQQNLEALPKDTLDKVAQGDTDALIALNKALMTDEDPSVGGAINALRNTDRVTLDGIDDGWRERSLLQMIRATEDPAEPAPVHFDAAAKAERANLSDLTDLPKGTEGNQHYRMLDVDGKPVRFEAVDANRITTDPATFQFKGGRDSAGASNALRAVDFDGSVKGKVIVYEREDGSLVVADGHDRVSLANRAPEPVKLDALVFREKDGWTAEQVRAEAARKNIQEGTGDLIDVAGAIRRHPEIVDDTMAVSTDFMADARSIARLSDEAFDAVAAGQVNPKHAVLVSDHVADKSRHMEVLRELDRRNPPDEASARRAIGNMLREPANIETIGKVMDIPLAEPHVIEARNDVLAGVMTTLRQEPGYIGEIETQAIAAVIRRLAEKPGLVSDTLAQAGRAVAEGQPIERAIDATLRRFEDVIGKAGVKGLADQPVRLASFARDLDMSPEARKARAEQMGFDTSKVWYHGTDQDFDAFDVNADAINRDQDSGAGVFLAGRSGEANFFVQKPTDLMGSRSNDFVDNASIIPVYTRLKNPAVFDTQAEFRSALDDAPYDRRGPGYAIREMLEQQGHDGIVIRNSQMDGKQDGGGEWRIVFDPSNIRSVNAAFDPAESGSARLLAALSGSDASVGRSMRADLDKLGYYSKALEAAKSLKQAKGTPEQMLAQLKAAGVKQAELDAVNISGLLDGKTSITRDDLVRYLTENRVGVNEAKYGGGPAGRRPFNSREEAAQYAAQVVGADGYVLSGNSIYEARPGIIGNRRGPLIGTIDQIGNSHYLAASERLPVSQIQQTIMPSDVAGRTKWSNYSLDPSNPTYRETVLHLPATKTYDSAAIRDQQNAARRELRSTTDTVRQSELMAQIAELDRMATDKSVDFKVSNFQSGHFSKPNIIGHMMTSMNRHEGKPVYTLDQIQSDWGQKLRDGGVRDEKKIAELKQRAIDAAIAADDAMHDINRMTGVSGGSVRGRLDGAAAFARRNGDAQAAERVKNAERLVNEQRLLEAEYQTANAATPGHPLVNTTDQWTNTTLRRALRQAVEADAEFIAIPSGDTVLSYNPGDTGGMRGFYGDLRTQDIVKAEAQRGQAELDAARQGGYQLSSAYLRDLEGKAKEQPPSVREGIVPKNLRKLLEKIDKDAAKPTLVEKIETPTKGMAGSGFTLFPLTDKVKRSVMEEGQPLFAKPAADITPAKLNDFAENLRQALDEATTPPPGRLDDPIKDAPLQVERLKEDLAEEIAVAMGQPSAAQLAALRSAERAKAVVDRASQMKAFAPGFSLRNLFDPQMKTPGNVASEPFNISDVVIKSRSITEIPVKAIKTIQDTVSLDVVKRMIDNPSTEVPSVFKFGGEYFVNDGNHRITAAKARGLDNIKAEVIEVEDRGTVAAGQDNAAAQLAHPGGDHPGHAAGTPLDGADRLVSLYERYVTQGREALDAVMPGTGRMIDEFVQANPEVVARIAEAIGAPTGRPQAAQMLEQAMPQFMSQRIIDMSKPVLLTPEANARMREIRSAIDETVKMLPPEYRIRVEDSLVFNFGDGDKRLDGLHDGYEKLIYVSMAAGDPVRTSRHEVIHALRQSGLMKDEEFAALYKFADRLGLRKAYEIDAQYKEAYTAAYGNRGADYVEQLLREETVANMFSDYSLNGRRFGDVAGGGMVDRMIDMIVSFMKQVRDIMGGYGFRNVYDVFDSIESGAMARRGMDQAPEAPRLADMTQDEPPPLARDLADVQQTREGHDVLAACRA